MLSNVISKNTQCRYLPRWLTSAVRCAVFWICAVFWSGAAWVSVVFADGAGRADSHAPIGVMADHVHKQGEFMISLRHMNMSMSGNLLGSDDIGDDTIASSVVNRFAGMPGMPPTLRIVPQEMTTSMQMLGFMYAPSNRLTLMLMSHYLNKDMTLRTYQGGMGLTQLGEFETNSSGWGDTSISGLFSLLRSHGHKAHVTLGISLPTGSIDERGAVLTPMNARADMRLPYAMQLGSGTYDVLPGITYSGYSDNYSWGAQYRAVIRTGENDKGYRLGDQQHISAWAQYLVAPATSISLRVTNSDTSQIDGIDSEIMGPVQTADPENYGRNDVSAAIGINTLGQHGWLKGHRLSAEYSLPLVQDVNGVQMKMDNMLQLGYQYAF